VKKDLGIALGGGGTRGFAHLGILKRLEEEGIFPDMIAGTSAGSIVGSFLASGKKSEEIYNLMKERKLTDFAKLTMPVSGLMSLEYLKEQLEELLPGKTFKDLKLPFYATVSNLLTGKVEYLTEGNVARAVQASSSIPVVFSPVEIDNQLYVDGGLLDNVPVQPLIGQCEKIIAVDIMPIEKVSKIKGIQEIAVRTFQMSVGGLTEKRKEACSILIEVEDLAGFNILDSGKSEEIYDIGYRVGRNLDLSQLL